MANLIHREVEGGYTAGVVFTHDFDYIRNTCKPKVENVINRLEIDQERDSDVVPHHTNAGAGRVSIPNSAWARPLWNVALGSRKERDQLTGGMTERPEDVEPEEENIR